ncbi:RIC1-domain-containing protein [Tothia fuscella]|uniref:RIC1-domain-containing protein n=1 Tax=Tothia fuscella TaxID=1048955 RepID=A0A9P4NY47_9PEZI|nr:RIC1-domain-containing protein [Tothia fuscella]
MYWPIGAPRIYAASKHELSPKNASTSDDGLETNTAIEEPGEEEGISTNGTVTPVQDGGDDTKSEEGVNGHEQHVSGRKNSHVLTPKSNGDAQHTYDDDPGGVIVGLQVSRSGHMFATITHSTLTVWQTKPTAAVASVLRSPNSLKTYGPNIQVLLRPDSAIIVIQTAFGYLITYSLATDHNALIYRTSYPDTTSGHARHKSFSGKPIQPGDDPHIGPGEGQGVREVSVRFRMVIKLDAGISKVLALDDELIVATDKPAAMQCIRWVPDNSGSQTSTQLLKSMSWMGKNVSVVELIYDRPMNISTWITTDGKAYAVQRISPRKAKESGNPKRLFQGYDFHSPECEELHAVKAAICARFSLIAVGCGNGTIQVYTAKDYAGHIPLSHKLVPPTSSSNHGKLTFLSYSPDGYCLFAGYERGWAMWSVYGKPGACSFTSDRTIAESNDENWLLRVCEGFWIGSGAQILLMGHEDNRLWVLDMARSAVTGCFSSANVARSLMQTNTGFMIYRGYDLPDLTALSSEIGLWHHVQVPSTYLIHQWPIRSAVISSDSRYVAIAGRRGLAHYSVNSGRWKMFDDPHAENEFTVRGGMCWHQHVLIAAVECNDSFEIRIYSRETALDNSHVMHVEKLPSPIVLLAPSGAGSLLVYTYDNNLYHYIINVTNASVRLHQVGQIALHGIIRAPPRVRALSWILPEEQLDNGDPSQDVAMATVVFLVDGKLVLLQPTTKESGELKYEMRIIASNVEYYALMRDQPYFNHPKSADSSGVTTNPLISPDVPLYYQNDLRDSLWYFDGNEMNVWTDVHDVLASASSELAREIPPPVKVPVDFYPLSILLNKGILFGVESEMVQRRDISFAFLRHVTRTHLFLPPVLRHHLAQYNSPSALYLSHHYQHLDYFPHALEVLLHDVLDDEVDTPPPADQALLPSILSFLSSFPQFLDIIVQCTRKTEVRSWDTLFAHLPTPQEMFEESLQRGKLKTAGGYLLVLHTLDELGGSEGQLVRLLRRGMEVGDWELCKELARFLVALDGSGDTLRRALEDVDVDVRAPTNGMSRLSIGGGKSGVNGFGNGKAVAKEDQGDYFSGA